MTEPDLTVRARLGGRPTEQALRWTGVAGAWLGIGTSPGALLVGAGIAARYGGAIPLLSLAASFALMFVLLWYQGRLGLNPPLGEGGKLTEIAPRYFGPRLERTVSALIALGMVGWFGFNVGLGGAALSALLSAPPWVGPVVMGLPVLYFGLRGLRSWNGLAALTTLAVLILVGLVVSRSAGSQLPVRLAPGSLEDLVTDAAAFIGYISVFSVRAPDFTAGLSRKSDLALLVCLLGLPVTLIATAGAGLFMATGSTDLVAVLSGPRGLSAGNLLIAISVVAPTFTILHSGAPALRSATGLPERAGMFLITAVGLTLAVLRFDLWLLNWVRVLAAMLPPLVVPLAIESTRRRRGAAPRRLPVWVWLPGALLSMGLTLIQQPLAPLAGLLAAFLTTLLIYRDR